jgi:hypothetical protein
MVVIGHSQGGLLTKMTVVESGTRFWDNISKEPFEQADISAETRDLLDRSLFVEPLPFVQRVVFIATPHRGSFLSGNIIGKIGRRLIRLPATVTKVGIEIVMLNPVGQLLLHRPLMAAGLVAQGRHGLGVRELDLEVSRADRRSTGMEQLNTLCGAAHNRLDVGVAIPGVPDEFRFVEFPIHQQAFVER